MAHMLDGYAIISKFTLDGSNVTLEKKYLESDAYKRANQAGKNVINEFGTRYWVNIHWKYINVP